MKSQTANDGGSPKALARAQVSAGRLYVKASNRQVRLCADKPTQFCIS